MCPRLERAPAQRRLHLRPCFGNSKYACLAPPAEDIAFVFLKEDVAGVTPAPIAGAGYLDTLDLKSETFVVAGYGTDAYITGSAAAPNPIVLFDGIRSYRTVTAIPARDAFPDGFLKITKSVCFGDSGGPLFHDGTVVAINTWTFSWRCDGALASAIPSSKAACARRFRLHRRLPSVRGRVVLLARSDRSKAREILVLRQLNAAETNRWTLVDAAWPSQSSPVAYLEDGKPS